MQFIYSESNGEILGLRWKQRKFTVNITIFFIENASKNSKCLTLGGIIGDSDTCNGIQCIEYKDGITSNKENLDKPIEEAGLRIIPHIEDSIQSKNTRIVLLSDDTDVLVLVLYFMQYFTSIGLEDL